MADTRLVIFTLAVVDRPPRTPLIASGEDQSSCPYQAKMMEIPVRGAYSGSASVFVNRGEQAVLACAPSPAVYEAVGQEVHAVAPMADENESTGQLVHAAAVEVELPAGPNRPAAHGEPMQPAFPVPKLYVPEREHIEHAAADADVEPRTPYEPAGQGLPVQEEAPLAEEYCPARHGRHDAPPAGTYVPAGQLLLQLRTPLLDQLLSALLWESVTVGPADPATQVHTYEVAPGMRVGFTAFANVGSTG